MKDAPLNMRVPKELKKKLQKLADEDKRKLSDYICIQLEQIVNSKKK